MPAESCSICRAFSPLDDSPGGHCHRHPPLLSIQQVQVEPNIYDMGWYHPYVERTDWCLDFLHRSHN